MRVTVMGAGNGGFATAADLALRGFGVTLFELEEFVDNIRPVHAAGGIHMDVLESFPRPGGFATLDDATTDVKKAVQNADLIFVIVPAFAHETYVKLMAPHLDPDQVVVFCPGYLGPLLLAREVPGLKVAETESLIYACRKTAPDRIWVRGYKKGLRAAALNVDHQNHVLSLVRQCYSDVVPAANIIETTLSNANALIHTPLMLLNAAHIERAGGQFLFYHEGMTPAVGKLIESLDEERLAIGRAWGVNLRTMYEQDYGWYSHQGARGKNIYDTHVTNPIYSWSMAPESLSHRYVAEDVPYGLALIESFGRHGQVNTKAISAMIDIFDALLDRDFRSEGRTLDSLGFKGMALEEIAAVLTGQRDAGVVRRS